MGGEGFKIWWWEESTGLGDFSRWGGGAGGGGRSKFFAGVGKTLMLEYLTKTSIFILKDFTINSINCIVW